MITLLLERLRQGEGDAFDELTALIYDDCRQRAHGVLRRERPGHPLQTTDLVNEGLLKLMQSDEVVKASNRGQLFHAFAQALRQILIDHARSRAAVRHGGAYQQVPLDGLIERIEQQSRSTVLELHRTLGEMAGTFPEEAKIVEMHWFGGHSLEEIAALLGVSLTTVERRHRFAKAELRRLLEVESGGRL